MISFHPGRPNASISMVTEAMFAILDLTDFLSRLLYNLYDNFSLSYKRRHTFKGNLA